MRLPCKSHNFLTKSLFDGEFQAFANQAELSDAAFVGGQVPRSSLENDLLQIDQAAFESVHFPGSIDRIVFKASLEQSRHLNRVAAENDLDDLLTPSFLREVVPPMPTLGRLESVMGLRAVRTNFS